MDIKLDQSGAVYLFTPLELELCGANRRYLLQGNNVVDIDPCALDAGVFISRGGIKVLREVINLTELSLQRFPEVSTQVHSDCRLKTDTFMEV